MQFTPKPPLRMITPGVFRKNSPFTAIVKIFSVDLNGSGSFNDVEVLCHPVAHLAACGGLVITE